MGTRELQVHFSKKLAVTAFISFDIVWLTISTGCTTEPSQVQPKPRVQLTTNESVDPLGVVVVADDSIVTAKESHSDNNPYRDAHNSPETYDAWINDKNGGGEYGDLNSRLHDEIRDQLRQYFRNHPIPHGYDHSRGDASESDDRYLAFAYQNWDWFDPNCQVRVQIVGNHVSRELLTRLQSLLVDDLAEWCIVLLTSTTRDFDNRHELLVFSNSVKVPSTFMTAYAEESNGDKAP